MAWILPILFAEWGRWYSSEKSLRTSWVLTKKQLFSVVIITFSQALCFSNCSYPSRYYHWKSDIGKVRPCDDGARADVTPIHRSSPVTRLWRNSISTTIPWEIWARRRCRFSVAQGEINYALQKWSEMIHEENVDVAKICRSCFSQTEFWNSLDL